MHVISDQPESLFTQFADEGFCEKFVFPAGFVLWYIKPKQNAVNNQREIVLVHLNYRVTCENNMLSSHVKISPLLRLHNKSRLSHQKTIKVKWFGISLVSI